MREVFTVLNTHSSGVIQCTIMCVCMCVWGCGCGCVCVCVLCVCLCICMCVCVHVCLGGERACETTEEKGSCVVLMQVPRERGGRAH